MLPLVMVEVKGVHMNEIVASGSITGLCKYRVITCKPSQVDLEKLELVDMDQIDMDDQGTICPSARGLGADLKQQWYSAIDEEVRSKLKEREAAMKAEVQASFPQMLQMDTLPCLRACGLLCGHVDMLHQCLCMHRGAAWRSRPVITRFPTSRKDTPSTFVQ